MLSIDQEKLQKEISQVQYWLDELNNSPHMENALIPYVALSLEALRRACAASLKSLYQKREEL